MEIGGFPTDSVTEDYLATLRLKERDTRVRVVRAFYAAEYVHAFRGIRAAPVGKALLMRLFG